MGVVSVVMSLSWPIPRMPDRQSNVPILVLDCDHEFENDRDQAKRLLDQVSKFIASL